MRVEYAPRGKRGRLDENCRGIIFGAVILSSIRATAPNQKQSKVIFDDTIQDAANEAHRLVKPKVIDFWGPVYTQCADEIGRGHFKRNQATHSEYVKKTARPMYKKASAAIRHAFKKMFDNLPDQFKEGTRPALTQIKEKFEQFLHSHTVRSDGLTNEKGESIATVKLLSEILGHLTKLKAAWGQEVVVPPEVEEEESEDDDINIDDLEDPDDGDDDYIEIDDDSDED
ncbi:uncharacterized protein PAC_13586 [Phialocephala subalpina]|uniref:Uncharacterized protein n=1 Tax=Phialocephala subalpina TaxID=576137 RepID=A0A1L7XF69_9HELO|nr:uncharacterized protein PAC_13586 [Phialocephala subalpina]